MHNTTNQQFLAQTQGDISATWTKPQLTVVPLHQALTGNSGTDDGAKDAKNAPFAS